MKMTKDMQRVYKAALLVIDKWETDGKIDKVSLVMQNLRDVMVSVEVNHDVDL